MSSLQSFLFQASIQIFVFALALLLLTSILRLVLRRRSSDLIALGMGIVVVLWFAAMLPLPGWFESILTNATSSTNALSELQQPLGAGEIGSVSDSTLVDYDATSSSDMSVASPLQNFVGGFMDELSGRGSQGNAISQGTLDQKPSSNWLGWAAILCVVAIAFGLSRLLVAVGWVIRLRRQTIPICGQRANECLDVVVAQLNCSRRVALMQIENGVAPFTVGSNKPTIYLPEDWPEWTEEQLKATLAHEVAHVQNRDYIKRLLAQLAVALNFYNPLVHWLAKQLVVEQEVCADDLAATVVGGRQSFLKTLAELALEKDYPTKSRLVPMFLPTRKTFFRRIEMLRKEKNDPRRSRLSFVFSAMLVLLIGIGAFGLRMPTVAVAAEGAIETDEPRVTIVQEEASLAFVPDEADYFVVLRPAAMYAAVGDIIDEAIKGEAGSPSGEWKEGFAGFFGIEVEDADQLTIVGDVSDNATAAMAVTYVLRANKAIDWLANDGLARQLKERFGATPAESFRGIATFETNRNAAGNMTPQDGMRMDMALAVIGQDTIVMSFGGELKANRVRLRTSLRVAEGPKAVKLKGWKPYANHPLSFHVASDVIEVVSAELAGQMYNEPMTSVLRSILEDINFVSGGLKLDEKITMDLRANCANEQGVTKLTQASSAVQLFLKSFSEAENVAGLEGDNKNGIQALFGALADSLETKAEGNDFVATVGMKGENAIMMREALPLISASRAGARRVDSANRCRTLMIAMHNYHDANGSLPPAVLTSESGKKYSWRVAVLPYLDQQALYDDYRFDEEWSSEHNQKVTARIPDVFQHPGNKEFSTANSCYFVIVGDETPFLDGKRTTLEAIADGTSQTLGIVEANMGIHWAEPRDIPFDTPDLISRLGGIDGGGFVASLCDGSTHFYRSDMDAATFKALLTSNGGEVVDFSKAWEK